MTGWIKLWRSIKNEGHLKMPGAAFKLWFYCMLEAAPRPDRARGLDTGELWLDYDGIRQIIGETGRQMSKSTVSRALQYLEQNGYLERQSKQFHSLKVRLLKWGETQSVSTAAAAEVAAAAAATAATPASPAMPVAPATAASPAGPVAAAVPVLNAYPAVCPFLAAGVLPPAGSPAAACTPTGTLSSTLAGTPTGTSASTLTGTLTGTPAGTPSGTKIIPGPVLKKKQELKNKELKIKKLKIKELKNKDLKEQVVVVDLLTCFEKEFGRPLSPLEVNQLTSWRSTLPEELILEALAQAVFRDKRSLAYTGGILRNWRRAGIRTSAEARRDKPGSGQPPFSPGAWGAPAVTPAPGAGAAPAVTPASGVWAAPAAWYAPDSRAAPGATRASGARTARAAPDCRAAPSASDADPAVARKKAFIKSLYL